MKTDKPYGLLNIHQFAELCRTTTRTIRFYDQKELLKPWYVDLFTKYRYYHPGQAQDFLKLRLLQNFHVSLSEIQTLAKSSSLEEPLELELEKLKKRIDEEQKEYEFLRSMKSFLYGRDDIGGLLKEEVIGPFTLFCKTFKNAEYDKTRNYSLELIETAKNIGVEFRDEYLMFYKNRHYQPKGNAVEIAQICPKDEASRITQLPEGYYFRNLPETKVLAYRYQGPFIYFILLYKRLNDFIDENRLTQAKTSIDYYLRYQVNSASEYDYLTKICFPIE